MTPVKLAELKAAPSYTEALKQYVETRCGGDSRTFLSTGPENLRGRTTSSVSEAVNWSLQAHGVRNGHPIASLKVRTPKQAQRLQSMYHVDPDPNRK